ncbi:hypothetical protein ACSSS7_004031 [Eimeria intestinalis]
MAANMKRVPSDGCGGDGLQLLPPNADCSLIFMHGRGGSPEEFVDLADMLNERPSLRGRFRLILPLAEEIMITKYQSRMHAWFDCRADRWDVDEDVQGYERSRKRIENLIQQEFQRGIKPERVFVAGFSQGGAMAYLVALRSSVPLGGAVSLSGWCPLLQELQVSDAFASGRTQILHAHGMLDQRVEYQFARSTYEAARAAIGKVAASNADRIHFLTYQSLTHSISVAEMSDVMTFVENCLAGKGLHPQQSSRGG